MAAASAAAGGETEHERRSARLVDEGFDVFDLTLDRIRPGVRAVPSSPAIVMQHGEELRRQ
jgi:hypothetical protein